MPYLPSRIAAMQAKLATFAGATATRTVTIERDDSGTDSRGGTVPSWAVVATNVPCSIWLVTAGSGASSTEVLVGDQYQTRLHYIAEFTAFHDMTDRHRLTFTDPNSGRVRHLMVQAFENVAEGDQIWHAHCVEIPTD